MQVIFFYFRLIYGLPEMKGRIQKLDFDFYFPSLNLAVDTQVSTEKENLCQEKGSEK